MFKKIRSSFFAGLMMAIALGVPLFVLSEAWSLVARLAEAIGFQFLANPNFNICVYLVIVLALICLAGRIFKFKFFRMCFDWLMAKIPLASTIAKFIPKNEELEILSDGNLKEARVEIYPGAWVTGLVTNKFRYLGRNYIRIVSLHSPLPFTGAILDIDPEKCDVVYTGRGVAEYFAMVVSFGARSSLDVPNPKENSPA